MGEESVVTTLILNHKSLILKTGKTYILSTPSLFQCWLTVRADLADERREAWLRCRPDRHCSCCAMFKGQRQAKGRL